ncbi:peptidase M56 BlaR1 [Desulfofarcimen acetoxidans DSM 771]|uniref:Peptidase M56 BlaR1 n=1 Tax=Desulfofarcimen acetoxidans (strain ATCC 49208 / DSM 771 / KCTC 5769 / VKM B-1644 / 5575) TaxID=485916 RepID=C8W2W3_DESAS|nr:peptidase M56 BlaR1 [Desulfofarcimen acetoxidans]ACV61119.1 peptidase M56 BlaR1 [Desulfofarcimen acetoxidans DSM 771]
MFDRVFLQILNMSFNASLVIIFVLIARLLLKKAPKIFSYVLWSIVLFHLVCPISFKGVWSLLPVNPNPISTDIIYSQNPKITTGLDVIDNTINAVLPAPATLGASINPLQIWIFFGEIIWLIGIAALILYSVATLMLLHKKLIGIHPNIFLPSTLSKRKQNYIVLHEQTHIRRFDHIVKIAGFLILAIHWFNPFVWVALILCNRDMEMSL